MWARELGVQGSTVEGGTMQERVDIRREEGRGREKKEKGKERESRSRDQETDKA